MPLLSPADHHHQITIAFRIVDASADGLRLALETAGNIAYEKLLVAVAATSGPCSKAA